MQRQLLGLWGQLAAGEPLVVRSLLPPAQILHHVRASFFSGGAAMREQARRQAAGPTQQHKLQGAAEAAAPPSAAAAQGQGQEQDAQSAAAALLAASAAKAVDMRRGYIRLAASLMGESAAAAARQGGLEAGGDAAASAPQGTASSPFWAKDEGVGADLQAALSLLADCCTSLAARGSGGGGCGDSAGSSDSDGSPTGGGSTAGDAALLQELLTLLLLPLLRRDSLARLPLLACLRSAGGPALLLPLLRLEQQQLRLLGLRTITACLSAAEDDTGPGPSGSSGPRQARSTTPEAGGRRSSLGSPSPEGRGGGEVGQSNDVIAAAGRLLAAFPLTAATRIALLEMLCDGAPWTQIDALAPAGPPAAAEDAVAGGDGTEEEDPAAAATLVRVSHPGAAAALLQLAAAQGCAARERAAVLGVLCLLCKSASLSSRARHANLDMLAAAPCCWQRLLLGCLRCGDPGAGVAASSTASGSEQRQAAASAWRLLVLLLARGVAASPAGGQQLLTLVGLLKANPPGVLYRCPAAWDSGGGGGGGTFGAWQLLQELLADIVQELLHAQAEDAAAREAPDSGSPHAVSSPRAAAAAVARAAAAGVQRAFSAGREAQPARQARRATSSEWDAWTHVSQWSTEPYCSNAAALLSLLDDCLSGTVLAPPGGALAPGGSALLWADPAALPAVPSASGPSPGDVASSAADGIPLPAWQELGAAPKQQPPFSPRLLLAAWHFLDRLHSSGCAAAASAAEVSRQPAGPPAPGLSEQQLQLHQQQRGLLLLQRLLLLALQAAPPETAQQAAAQASQLLPPLLADAAADGSAADAAAGRMQLLLAAVVQCHRGVAAKAAAAQQQEHLLPLPLQHRLGACEAAANAIVEAAPWAWGDVQASSVSQPAPAVEQRGQQHEQQLQPRSMQELLPLLQPAAVLAAARQQVQFMRHCCAAHERAAPVAQAACQAAAQQQVERAAAAEEASQQCLGLLLAADRLRRAAGRQAADEQRQLRRRQWRDLRRGLTSGRGLWAEDEDPEGPHWKLDVVEDPSRRRMRLRRNFRFERYSDGPRAGKGSATALAAAAAGAEPEEQELLAVAALVPGGSQAFASPLLQAEEGEEEAEGSEAGEPEAAASGPEQLQQQTDASGLRQREESPATGMQSGSERQPGRLAAIPEADPAQQPPAAESGSPASRQQELDPQPGAAGGAAAVEAPQPAQPLPALPQQQAQQQELVKQQQAAQQQAVQQQEQAKQQQATQQHATQQQQQGAQQAAVRQQAQAAEEPGAEQAAAGAPQAMVRQQAQAAEQPRAEQQRAEHERAEQALTSEDVEAPPQVGAAPALFSSRCQWVTPKRLVPGRLHITAAALHFVGDAPGGGASLAPWLSGGRAGRALYGPEGGGMASAGGGEGEAGEHAPPHRRHRSWLLEGLTEVHHSRYLLQPTALECFMADRRSHALFNLPSSQAMHAAAAALQRARPSAVVYDRRRKLEWALRLQQRWLRWEISSFDYLMALNTLAGRTYSDLNQYPVFPWVLADYTSPSLDLTSPASFRDLSKPMGALDERRLQFFRERFESLRADQRHGGGAADGAPHLPPFHYGSHYSSAGIVLFYLVRMEGFTKLNRALQGGRFDHGDRLFHSLPATWAGCLDNTADVKELIPEFYYCPEFLRNSNGFDLGVRQDGLPLGDVVLPPWAHGSAEEFVRVMREALESDHVSQHLHSWIDLIFGCKQRGQAAEEACNVFYFLTYEGSVDLDAIQDPAMRAAVEEQILHFGQTPMQLFRRRHPQRGAPPPPSLNPLLNGPDAMRRSALTLPPPHRSGVPVAQLWVVEGRITQLFGDGAVSTARWCPGGRQDLGAFTFSTAGLLLDTSGSTLEPDPTPPRMLVGAWAAAPAAQPGGGSGTTDGRRQLEPQYALIHGDRAVLSGGYWDGSLRAHSPEDGRLLQSLCYHKDAVTCLAASADGSVVVTGSADTTLMVWEANPAFGRATRGRQPPQLPLLPRPRCSLYGHRDAVTCVAVSPELDLVVSGAADGSILLHSLGTGRYVRSLALPLGVPPTLLRLVPSIGAILVHSHVDLQLHLYTVNCRHLASADTHERLAALAPTPDGRLLLAAGTSGLATLRWLHSLKPVLRYDAGRGPITALALTPEGCFLAGTTEGSLVLFAPDPRRRITRRFNLAA